MKDDFGLLEIGYIACANENHDGIIHHPAEMERVKLSGTETKHTYFYTSDLLI